MSRGQLFTLDLSIASLFLVVFSIAILWFVTYFFQTALNIEEDSQMQFVVKQTYDEILSRLSVEQGVISKEVLDSISESQLVNDLGIQQFGFFLEVLDLKRQRIEPGAYLGTDPTFLNDVMIENDRIYAITRPAIYYTGNRTPSVVKFLMWRKRPIIDTRPPEVTAFSFSPNTSVGGLLPISVKADDMWGLSNVSVNITGPYGSWLFKMYPEYTTATYRLTFDDTDFQGTYTIQIFAYDSSGNVNDSFKGSFVVE